ncbi:MAG TPA: hypothetical protein VGM90_10875 [Kofleriaceae bacterium]|jgi:hypothetical protein
MSAIDRMLSRLGVVRLREYGLVLTPEDRILSIRPTTLDDGLGGRIVGWRDNDLAPAELQAFGAPKVPVRRPQFPSAAYPIVPAPAPIAVQGTPAPFAAVPVAAPIQAAAPAIPVAAARPIARPAASLAVVMPPPVAAAPVVEEDDWEWTIAIARARAAAEWAEEGAATAASEAMDEGTFTQVEALPAAAPPRRRQPTMPPPLGFSTPAQPIRALPRIEAIPTVSRTVIPVPMLPTSAPRNFAPVVRAPGAARQMPHPLPPQQPRRFAKGTGPMLPTTKALSVGDDTTPNLSVGDETVPAIYAAPAASATLPRVVARK